MTMIEQEYPICAICASDRRKLIHAEVRDLFYDLPGTFGIVRCVNCGLVYLYPRPNETDLGAYYPSEYASYAATSKPFVKEHGDKDSKAFKTLRYAALLPYRLRFGNNASTLPPFGQRRMLDVGCGAGEYLQDMQRLGWEVYGVDFSEIAVRSAQSRVEAARVQVGTIESLDPAVSGLDLITLNHCLEHVPDPKATLTEAHRRLNNAGKVKIIIPDAAGFEARIFGRYWLGFEVPRHLYNFSKPTLDRLLAETGFATESCRPQFCPWTFYDSVHLTLQHRLRVNRPQLNQIINIPLLAIASLSYAFGNSGVLEIVASKAAR